MSSSAGRPLRRLADIPVTELRHVSEKRAAALASIGVTSVFDLLTTYPRRYVDRTRHVDLSDLSVGDEIAIFAEVTKTASRRTRQGRALVEITVNDGTGALKVVFFNQAWRERQLPAGTQAMFFGKVSDYRGTRQMTNPVVDVIIGASGQERDPSRVGRIVPIYRLTKGVTALSLRRAVRTLLDRFADEFGDPLPSTIRSKLELMPLAAAIEEAHWPHDFERRDAALRRLAFDELLAVQLSLVRRRRRQTRGSAPKIAVDTSRMQAIEAAIRAALADGRSPSTTTAWTRDQRSAIDDVLADLTDVLQPELVVDEAHDEMLAEDLAWHFAAEAGVSPRAVVQVGEVAALEEIGNPADAAFRQAQLQVGIAQ